jgi:hypothetical protein
LNREKVLNFLAASPDGIRASDLAAIYDISSLTARVCLARLVKDGLAKTIRRGLFTSTSAIVLNIQECNVYCNLQYAPESTESAPVSDPEYAVAGALVSDLLREHRYYPIPRERPPDSVATCGLFNFR